MVLSARESAVVQLNAGDSLKLAPLTLKRGTLVHFNLETTGYAVRQKEDPASPQFNFGIRSSGGVAATAKIVAASGNQMLFDMVVPIGTRGEYRVNSRLFKVDSQRSAARCRPR
jgi:hypothetical protein